MKIAMIIVRTLMGLLFIFGSVAFFLKLGGPPQLEGNMKLFFEGITAATYFLPLLKTTELICGLAFVAGRFVPLAAVIIAPVIINILMVHIFLEPSGLPVAIFLTLGNIFLGYYHWKSYAPLFEAKA